MPEVRRGSRAHLAVSPAEDALTPPATDYVTAHNTTNNTTNNVTASPEELPTEPNNQRPRVVIAVDENAQTNGSASTPTNAPFARRLTLNAEDNPRKSLSYSRRPSENAYYDSRAATQGEYRRRGRTLEEYYEDNPHLLPQLPFTWHHGKKRWRLSFLIFMMFVDACAVPIALYYGMFYAGDVEGWIIFAVVTTIWGGPTYLEFAIRTLRLIKKERFYRPLGTESRWSFDLVNWTSVIAITVVTALFIIGSAPHNVWLRVLCMPGPAILYSLGGVLAIISLYHHMNWKAPFRISSTGKGEKVLPAVYYFIEDVVAVNAGGGRPYREALAARYRASPRFRQMLMKQSLFWSIPSLLLAIPLTVIAVINEVPATVAYGICTYSLFQHSIPLPFVIALSLCETKLTSCHSRLGRSISLGACMGRYKCCVVQERLGEGEDRMGIGYKPC